MANLPGGSLGKAMASIEVDISQLRGVQQQVRTVSQRIGRDLKDGIGRGAQAAQTQLNALGGRSVLSNLGNLANSISSMRGLLIGGLVAGLARAGLALTEFGVQSRRATAAFDILSGSAANAAARVQSIRKASGDVVSNLEAMRIGSQAAALNLANTSAELRQLTRAARAVTFVSPVIHDMSAAISELGLASANLSFRRLDQLGLTVTEVKARMEVLQRTMGDADENAVFLAAAVGILNEKYGDLLENADLNASGFERLRAAVSNATADVGEHTGWVDRMAGGLATAIERVRAFNEAQEIMANGTDDLTAGQKSVVQALEQLNQQTRNWMFMTREQEQRVPALIRDFHALGEEVEEAASSMHKLVTEHRALQDQMAKRRADRRERTQTLAQGIADIDRDYARDRTQTIADFGRSQSESASQFARQMGREADDFARQRARDMAAHARQIANIQEAQAEQEASNREELADRILAIEDAFAKNMARLNRDHRDNLLSAASRLDARAVYEEQRRFSRQREDMLANRNERLALERATAAEQLADQQEAAQKRMEALREDFNRRLAMEDEDRALRLSRTSEDHLRQMQMQSAAHARRLNDLQQFHNDALAAQWDYQKLSIKMWNDAIALVNSGYGQPSMPQSVSNSVTNRSTNVTIGSGAFQVLAGPGAETDTGAVGNMERQFMHMLETLQ